MLFAQLFWRDLLVVDGVLPFQLIPFLPLFLVLSLSFSFSPLSSLFLVSLSSGSAGSRPTSALDPSFLTDPCFQGERRQKIEASMLVMPTCLPKRVSGLIALLVAEG